jgi:predicted RNA-binding Zn-ribbon protein involved in translation (DUF1610 family)
MQRYKLTRSEAARLGRLLHMEYTLRELADELDTSKRQIRTAIEAGCPHRRTGAGHICIVGDEFRDWYHEICRRRKRPLRSDEAFCLSCRRAVPLSDDAEVYPAPHGVERVTAACPLCGNTINRFRKVVGS